jgi:hypothetical protein
MYDMCIRDMTHVWHVYKRHNSCMTCLLETWLMYDMCIRDMTHVWHVYKRHNSCMKSTYGLVCWLYRRTRRMSTRGESAVYETWLMYDMCIRDMRHRDVWAQEENQRVDNAMRERYSKWIHGCLINIHELYTYTCASCEQKRRISASTTLWRWTPTSAGLTGTLPVCEYIDRDRDIDMHIDT